MARTFTERAFDGIRDRMWQSVEGHVASQQGGFSADYPPMLYAEATRADKREVICSLRNRFSVYFDCLHLSVATMTTLGYGNVNPRAASARICTDIQVLASVLLVIVAFSLALASARRPSDESDSAEA